VPARIAPVGHARPFEKQIVTESARLAHAQRLDPEAETNFAAIENRPGLKEQLRERGLLVGDLRPGWLRAVTHLDIGDDDIDAAIPAMQEVLGVHA